MQRTQSREEQPINLIQNQGSHLKDVSRDALFEYAQQVKNLGSTLFQLLSEVLGLKPSYLAGIECNQGQIILLQDEIGGLQILHENRWVNVTPTPEHSS